MRQSAGAGGIRGPIQGSGIGQRAGGVAQTGVEQAQPVKPKKAVDAHMRRGVPGLVRGRGSRGPPPYRIACVLDVLARKRQEGEGGKERPQLERRDRVVPRRHGQLAAGPPPLSPRDRDLGQHPMPVALEIRGLGGTDQPAGESLGPVQIVREHGDLQRRHRR